MKKSVDKRESICYYIKDKEWLRRSYEIPYESEEAKAILKMVDALEQEPVNFYRHMFGKNYRQISEFGGGWVEFQSADKVEQGMDYYESKSITQEQAAKLYQAILKDVEAGTLMPYNVYRNENWSNGVSVSEYKESSAYLTIEYKQPYVEPETTYINMSENSIGYAQMVPAETTSDNWRNCHINFGPNCENIINALVEFGIIKSADDIWWGENISNIQ